MTTFVNNERDGADSGGSCRQLDCFVALCTRAKYQQEVWEKQDNMLLIGRKDSRCTFFD